MGLKCKPSSEPLHISVNAFSVLRLYPAPSGPNNLLGISLPPAPGASRVVSLVGEREFCIDNLLFQIHFIIEMIWRTGLALWEFPLSTRRWPVGKIECVLLLLCTTKSILSRRTH